MIRKATINDIDAVSRIFEKILDREEKGQVTIGWKRGVYPTRETALTALNKDDLFVFEEEGEILASMRINQEEVKEYADAKWEYDPPKSEIMVLHTLTVDPDFKGKGTGKAMVAFYEEYALKNGCHYLRMDTNAINSIARNLYKKLGYKEIGIVPSVFNGISGVQLVCLEKKI